MQWKEATIRENETKDKAKVAHTTTMSQTTINVEECDTQQTSNWEETKEEEGGGTEQGTPFMGKKREKHTSKRSQKKQKSGHSIRETLLVLIGT